MATPNPVAGNRFRLMRGNGASPEVFTFVCTATSQDLDEKVDYEDAMLPDCDNPTALSTRVSVPKSQSWDVSGSGKCDHRRFLFFRADFDAQTLKTYQLVIDQPATQGGGIYQGAAYVDALKLSKDDNGMVSFTFSLKGQGRLAWTAAS